MKHIIIRVIFASLITFTVLLSFNPLPALALVSDQVQQGADAAANATGTPADADKTLTETAARVINILSITVAVIAVIMIIVGGFRYVTSGGKQESVTGAKNTILYGLIGLVIVAGAQSIVNFVLKNLVDATP